MYLWIGKYIYIYLKCSILHQRVACILGKKYYAQIILNNFL